MPQVYFLDNYCYEISNTCISIYKYDILENTYVKIDQYSTKQKLPARYQSALQDIEESKAHDILTRNFSDIKIAS